MILCSSMDATKRSFPVFSPVVLTNEINSTDDTFKLILLNNATI